jgi:hypothetical protein
MSSRADHGFEDISAMALNAAIIGSILAEPEACLTIVMALPCRSAPCCHHPFSVSGP